MRSITAALLIGFAAFGQAAGQTAAPQPGRPFVTFQKYSAEQDAQILKLFDGLRVADVSDGMDMAGLQDVGLSPAIEPLWRDTENFEHRITGVAVTVRMFRPTAAPRRWRPMSFASGRVSGTERCRPSLSSPYCARGLSW